MRIFRPSLIAGALALAALVTFLAAVFFAAGADDEALALAGLLAFFRPAFFTPAFFTLAFLFAFAVAFAVVLLAIFFAGADVALGLAALEVSSAEGARAIWVT